MDELFCGVCHITSLVLFLRKKLKHFVFFQGEVLPYGMFSGVRFYGGGSHTPATDAIRDHVAIGSTSHSPATIYDVV